MQKKVKKPKGNIMPTIYRVLDVDMNGLSKLLRVSKSNISSWNTGKMAVPLKHALRIEVLSKGAIKAEDVSPLAYKRIYGK